MKKAIMVGPVLLALFVFIFHAAAQSSVKGARIPKDFLITLSSSSIGDVSKFTISADGIVRSEQWSNMPPRKFDFSSIEKIGEKPTKPPQLKDRLSEKQLRTLITDFDKAGFSEMADFYFGYPASDKNICTNHSEAKLISILTNGKKKAVSFDLGCSYSENSPLNRFLALYDKILTVLAGVKKVPVK